MPVPSSQRPALVAAALALLAAGARAGSDVHVFTSPAAGANFGSAVAVAGDVDRDGLGDYVVGAYLEDLGGTDSGTVRVYSGSHGGVLFTFVGAPGNQLGFSVAGAGDVNRDGYADILAGADLGNYARVYSGRNGAVLRTFLGDASGDRFGTSVAGAGDVDQDGYDDLAVGAPQADGTLPGSERGIVRIFSGHFGGVLRTLIGDSNGMGLGRAVASAGRVDRDPIPDLIAGANTGSNVALVYSGADGSVVHAFFGDANLDWFGSAVAGAGDVDQDGHADVIVGAPQGFLGPGYARLYSGADGSLIRQHQGHAGLDLFGWSVSAAGDVDRDGSADVLIGSPFAESLSGSFNAGVCTVFSGATGEILAFSEGQNADEALGWSVSGTPCSNPIAGAPLAGPGGEARVLDLGQLCWLRPQRVQLPIYIR